MMELIIKINLDNAAFEDDPEAELENIFEQVNKLNIGRPEVWQVRDSNGNTVGTVEVKD